MTNKDDSSETKEEPQKPEAGSEKKEQESQLSVSIPAAELRQLKEEASEYKDKYLRLLAESENFRKRMQKERQEMIQYAVQNLIADFLEPIDHFENALQHFSQVPNELKHWGTGFQMIVTQFKDVLTNNGAIAFESKGTTFDPHLHEAIETVETDTAPPGIVMEEVLRGYKMGDKIIRPARVKVSKEKKIM